MKPLVAKPFLLGLLTGTLALIPVLLGWWGYRMEARLREAQLFEATSGLVGERMQLMAARHFSAFNIIRNQMRAQIGGKGDPVQINERVRASLPHLSALGYASEENGRLVLRWVAFGEEGAPKPGSVLDEDPGRAETFSRSGRQPTPVAGTDGERRGTVFVADAVGDLARPYGFVVGWLDLKSLCADPSLPLVSQGILNATPLSQVKEAAAEQRSVTLGEAGGEAHILLTRGPGFAAAYGEVTPWVVLTTGLGCAGLLGFLAALGSRTARLRQALAEERTRVRLAQTFSHEFKTPLSVILSSAELLEMGAGRLGTDRQAALLGQIRDSTSTLSRMASEMLLFSRLEAGSFVPHREPVELGSLCAGLVREAEAAHRVENRILMKAEGRATLDPSLFRAVVDNLLGNALKYSAGETPVRLEAGINGPVLKLTVTDSGIGIPSGQMSRVGEPFFRAENVGGIPGTGLGVAIAKRAAELMGGSLGFSSEEGKGTTATLTIPQP